MHFRQCYYIRDGPRLPFFDNSIADFPNLRTLTISINYEWSYTAYMRGGFSPQQHHYSEKEKAAYSLKFPGRPVGIVEWVQAAEADMKARLPQFESLEVRVPTMYDFRTRADLNFVTANVYDTFEEDTKVHGIMGPEPVRFPENPTDEEVLEMLEMLRQMQKKFPGTSYTYGINSSEVW